MAVATLWNSDGPTAEAACRWTASNRALSLLVDCHRHALTPVEDLARQIRYRLQRMFPMLDALCRITCPWCPDPCCIVNRVWFDFHDLLFIHLNRLPLPPAQLHSRSGEPCFYLSHHGCRLPRIIRPWSCTQYICATQQKGMSRLSRKAAKRLENALRSIKSDRLEMENRFVETIAQQRRKKRGRSRCTTITPTG